MVLSMCESYVSSLGLSLLRYVSSLVLEAVAIHLKLGIEPVVICFKFGIAIHFKLGSYSAGCDTFRAWYWRLLRYVSSLVLEPVAIRSKLGIGACYDTFKAWY